MRKDADIAWPGLGQRALTGKEVQDGQILVDTHCLLANFE